jgi:hypothetical protein
MGPIAPTDVLKFGFFLPPAKPLYRSWQSLLAPYDRHGMSRHTSMSEIALVSTLGGNAVMTEED